MIPIVVVRRCCTTHVVIPKLDSRCNGITRVLLFRECRHRTLHPKVIPIEFFGGRRGKKQQRVREPDMFPVKQVGVQTNPWHCCVHNGASLFMLGPPLTLMEIFPSATFATYYIFFVVVAFPFCLHILPYSSSSCFRFLLQGYGYILHSSTYVFLVQI